MAKLSVSELLDLATAVGKTVDAGALLADNGGIDAGDLGDLPEAVKALSSWGAVDFAAVLPQAADLDSMEATTVATHFRTVFRFPASATVEQVVETGLGVVLSVVAAWNNWRAGTEKLKALQTAAA